MSEEVIKTKLKPGQFFPKTDKFLLAEDGKRTIVTVSSNFAGKESSITAFTAITIKQINGYVPPTLEEMLTTLGV